MIRRPLQPSFGPGEKERLLTLLGDARHLVILFGASQPLNSETRPYVDTVKTSVDKLAEHLTGDPRYYWHKGHSAGGGPKIE